MGIGVFDVFCACDLDLDPITFLHELEGEGRECDGVGKEGRGSREGHILVLAYTL